MRPHEKTTSGFVWVTKLHQDGKNIWGEAVTTIGTIPDGRAVIAPYRVAVMAALESMEDQAIPVDHLWIRT
jgi:hypothetical protein